MISSSTFKLDNYAVQKKNGEFMAGTLSYVYNKQSFFSQTSINMLESQSFRNFLVLASILALQVAKDGSSTSLCRFSFEYNSYSNLKSTPFKTKPVYKHICIKYEFGEDLQTHCLQLLVSTCKYISEFIEFFQYHSKSGCYIKF